MDHFGIGAAMQGIVRVYLQSARRTGRTSSLVESLKDGDRICFLDMKEAERVRRLCLDRGVHVECITIPADCPWKVLEKGTSKGRTLFDHSWVEQYYLAAMEKCQSEIDHFEQQASDYSVAHRETRRRAEELLKWHG